MLKLKKQPKNFVESEMYNTTDYKEFIGLKYNELTVLSFPGYTLKKDKLKDYKIPVVEVKCSCGTIFKVQWDAVKNLKSKSCGHIHKFYYTDPYDCDVRGLYVRYRARAKKDNREFTITQDEFRSLIVSPCSYCGIKPSQIHRKTNCQASIPHNGVDRIDSSKGYVQGNVAPSCKFCNRAKSNSSLEEFNNYIIRLMKFASVKNRAKTVNGEIPNTVLSSEITKGSETV